MFPSSSELQRPKRPVEGFIPNPKQRLEEQCPELMRLKRFAFRSEQTYTHVMEKPGLGVKSPLDAVS